MSAEKVETLVESQNFMEHPSKKKKKHMGEKQKLQKEMKKRYKGFDPVEIPGSLGTDLSIQESKEFEGKIKLEHKLQKVKILGQGLSLAFLSAIRSGSHKTVY